MTAVHHHRVFNTMALPVKEQPVIARLILAITHSPYPDRIMLAIDFLFSMSLYQAANRDLRALDCLATPNSI